jgi:hypothetical protein
MAKKAAEINNSSQLILFYVVPSCFLHLSLAFFLRSAADERLSSERIVKDKRYCSQPNPT